MNKCFVYIPTCKFISISVNHKQKFRKTCFQALGFRLVGLRLGVAALEIRNEECRAWPHKE